MLKAAFAVIILGAAGGLLLPARKPDPRARVARWIRGLILLILGLAIVILIR